MDTAQKLCDASPLFATPRTIEGRGHALYAVWGDYPEGAGGLLGWAFNLETALKMYEIVREHGCLRVRIERQPEE